MDTVLLTLLICLQIGGAATKTNIIHAKSGNTVMYLQGGGIGTATGFYRGLAVTTDSHWIQVQPATNGGSTDLLRQRHLYKKE